ncbi:MAG: hypothetical protein WBI44_03095 [Syntrophaceticus sp.]|nr:hypothetical protein [Syntrophomonadaceae bacterium]
MTSGCSVCNGLTHLAENCPACGNTMEDCGKINSYVDPYGPYEDTTTEEETLTGDDQCVHFLQCPNCDQSSNYTVHRDEI